MSVPQWFREAHYNTDTDVSVTTAWHQYCNLKYCNGGTENRGGGHALTPGQEADVVRQLRRFRHPLDLAKEYGVSKRTILDISRRARSAR